MAAVNRLSHSLTLKHSRHKAQSKQYFSPKYGLFRCTLPMANQFMAADNWDKEKAKLSSIEN